jgi:hypothetical protein
LLIQEVEKLLVLQQSSFIFEKEVELLKNINKEDFTSVILACEKNILILLVKFSDGLWVLWAHLFW